MDLNHLISCGSKPGWSQRRFFVGQMSDIFGDWVEYSAIEAILDKIEKHSEWTFLFLTKNPKRLLDFKFPSNAWGGATIDTQKRVKDTEKAFRKLNATVKFVPCAPLLEPVTFNDISIFDWILIGAQNKTERCPSFQPNLNGFFPLLKE